MDLIANKQWCLYLVFYPACSLPIAMTRHNSFSYLCLDFHPRTSQILKNCLLVNQQNDDSSSKYAGQNYLCLSILQKGLYSTKSRTSTENDSITPFPMIKSSQKGCYTHPSSAVPCFMGNRLIQWTATLCGLLRHVPKTGLLRSNFLCSAET